MIVSLEINGGKTLRDVMFAMYADELARQAIEGVEWRRKDIKR